ncbi:tetraacyldisaccharide 4'-kinase [Parapusillimonas granuli]|uniref:Tetraacyldisaccharide 4'-kinase n=1 Tax=Parapusillimonas granuli TaxID=380911 RepID=A0A853G258_9BURK|nr:tetraacyldisaccharide 4'-kinase [Parapusillimonas granuli]MBB5217254.1 tetraacyldisaccharide 4'-kinase [Parapusillimonas granuli]NYT50953.1 tetraacyldisaccharide 4'-kinase [Parapusillimonas granuli]
MKAPAALVRGLHSAWSKKGWISTLLLPLSWIAAAAVARKRSRYANQPALTHHCAIPVVVVGNIYVGGTGKTPVVIALLQALQARGWRPGVVSRGYGIKLGERARTGQGELAADRYGDEPALIARATGVPVSVHPDRPEAARRLQRDFPQVDIIVADDGLQHLALGRDLEILVQDGRGVGNGRMLPAGPLREPADRLRYVDVIVTNLSAGQLGPAPVDSPARQVAMRLAPAAVERLVSGETLSWPDWLAEHGGEPAAAVAGIGRPDRFFDMLRHHGLELSRALSLEDHADYAESPFAGLTAPAILITGKDAVKCGRFQDPRLWVVHAEPRFSDPGWLDHVHDMLRMIARHKASVAQRRRGD